MSKIKSVTWDGKSTAKYAHLKIDGAFLRVVKDENGEIKCLSSLDTDLTLQISNCKPRWLINLHKNMPLNSSVLGELYYYDVEEEKGCPASFIKTGLAESVNWFDERCVGIDKRILGNRRKNKEINKDGRFGSKQLRFATFAIEYGFDCITSTSDLEEVELAILRLGVEFARYIRIKDGMEYYTKDSLLNSLIFYQGDCKGLAEGWVLKDSNLYGWRKVKKENTIDCFITGYVPGQGKYEGKVGSLKCCVLNEEGKPVEIATVSGFSDEIRDWLTEMFNGWSEDVLKMVIEVEYQFVADKGRLRHPRFKDFRDDKLWNECITEQDMNLVEFWG